MPDKPDEPVTDEAAEHATRFHEALFQETLVRARELEAVMPPVGPPKETLAHVFVHIARLYGFMEKDEELGGLIDFQWLIDAHIENVRRSLDTYRAMKSAGLTTEPKMN